MSTDSKENDQNLPNVDSSEVDISTSREVLTTLTAGNALPTQATKPRVSGVEESRIQCSMTLFNSNATERCIYLGKVCLSKTEAEINDQESSNSEVEP